MRERARVCVCGEGEALWGEDKREVSLDFALAYRQEKKERQIRGVAERKTHNNNSTSSELVFTDTARFFFTTNWIALYY